VVGNKLKNNIKINSRLWSIEESNNLSEADLDFINKPIGIKNILSKLYGSKKTLEIVPDENNPTFIFDVTPI
jgi:hypothetical protein